jgi:hypothetical protein
MSITPTQNVGLAKLAKNFLDWHLPTNANLDLLDAQAAVGGLGVKTAEDPSASLNVVVGAAGYLNPNGTVGTVAASTAAMTASATNYIYMTTAGAIVVNTSGWPGSSIYRIAQVIAGATTITAIADARVFLSPSGPGSGFLLLAGGTMADGAAIVAGTTTGLKIASAPAQFLAFWGATPAAQPSGASQAAVGTLATRTVTLVTVGATNTADQSATINSNEAALAAQVANAVADFATAKTLLNAIRTALAAAGLMKGGA